MLKIKSKFDSFPLWTGVVALGLIIFVVLTAIAVIVALAIVHLGVYSLIWFFNFAMCFFFAYVILK